MRISELYGLTVAGDDGAPIGEVRDVRLRLSGGSRGGPRILVAGLVVGPKGLLSRAAHAWGYAEGRARGPAMLRWLMARAIRRSRFVPAKAVREWDGPAIRISGSGEDLQPLSERESL